MNKHERTYSILLDRIHAGEYQPLARLNIEALAREFGVSPIPVREALRRLEAEGWVQFKPNIGAVIAPVDATSWEQEMVCLAILEGAASGAARSQLRKLDLVKLRRIAGQMTAVAAQDPLRFSELNRQLHDTVVERCPNVALLELLRRTHRNLDRVRRTMFVYLPDRSLAALHEHDRLIELLESGTDDEVESYARWHKMQTVDAYRAIHHANDSTRALSSTKAGPARAQR